jgi:hypothetical protein
MTDFEGLVFPASLQVREQLTSTKRAMECIFIYPGDGPTPELVAQARSLVTSTAGVLILTKRDQKLVRIQGGTSEDRQDALLFLLERMTFEGQPLFVSPVPRFGIWLWQQLFPALPDTATCADLRQIPEVQYDKWTTPIPKLDPAFDQFNQHPLITSPAIAALLVAYFAPTELDKFYAINAKPEVLKLSLPVSLQIRFDLQKSGLYQLSFADIPPHTAGDIRGQIDRAIAVLRTQDCFIVTLANTDPVKVSDLEDQLPDYVVIRLPIEDLHVLDVEEEDAFDDDALADVAHSATAKLMITARELTAEDEAEVRAIAERFYAPVQLVLCSKCKCVYNPASDIECFRYEHGGHQIPFENGEMEVVLEVRGDEPVMGIKGSCCGERPIDHVPIDCKDGKKEPNGVHEPNFTSDQGSQFTFERKTVADFV